jgi:hypothetical protein
MTTISLFVYIHDHPSITEILVPDPCTERELHAALLEASIVLDAETQAFADEREEPIDSQSDLPIRELKHGHRIHVTRHRRIKVTVNYLEHQAHRHFTPGSHVRAVKAWAVHEFGLDHKDALEHVLKVCGTAEAPPGDTPLHSLLHGQERELCFNLVPEKRIEG